MRVMVGAMGLCLLGSLCSVAMAHLIVVRDQGETVAFAPYLTPISHVARGRTPLERSSATHSSE